MKNWIMLILAITTTNCTTMPTAKRGTIIILQGTSSSGKTSIIQELQKINPLYYSCDIDSFMKNFLIKNPTNFDDLDHTVQLFAALFNSFFQTIQDHVDAGSTVLCDSVDTFFTEKLYHTFADTKIITVLVYLPLDMIQQRVDAYNFAHALQRDKKTAMIAARQFIELYKQQNAANNLVIDTTTTDIIKKSLQEMIAADSASLASDDFLICYAQNIYNSAATTFALNTTSIINLVAKMPYDFMVNNGTHTQKENAHLINAYIAYVADNTTLFFSKN